ncbi:MAG TPA: NUDIX hydrolase [Actinomycetota bacterium]|nr:NUDIX hydrolase [Actinomycetota bacterium]
MRTTHQTSAGGVVVRHGEGGPEVLLASRRTRRGDLVWGLPKGLVEPGESAEDTAMREVREETGYPARVRQPLGDVSYWFVWEGTRIRKTVHFFLMEPEGDRPGRRDAEMEEVAWFPIEDAVRTAGFDSEKDMIRRASAAVGT